MKPRVLLILTQDPRTSSRALEGIRLAAGVGTWQRLELRLYLDGPAVPVLDPEVEDLEESADYLRYLSVLGDLNPPIHIPAGATAPTVLVEPRLSLQPTSVSQLAQLAANSDYILRF